MCFCKAIQVFKCTFAALVQRQDGAQADFLRIQAGELFLSSVWKLADVTALDGKFWCKTKSILKLKIPKSRRCKSESCAHLPSAVSCENQAEGEKKKKRKNISLLG